MRASSVSREPSGEIWAKMAECLLLGHLRGAADRDRAVDRADLPSTPSTGRSRAVDPHRVRDHHDHPKDYDSHSGCVTQPVTRSCSSPMDAPDAATRLLDGQSAVGDAGERTMAAVTHMSPPEFPHRRRRVRSDSAVNGDHAHRPRCAGASASRSPVRAAGSPGRGLGRSPTIWMPKLGGEGRC